jgi:glycosyltransferase involved in cell wall biosynthesis
MRILYFHQHFSTPNGSVGIRSYEMASRLVHHGHQVTMVCGSYGGGETGLTVPFKFGKRTGYIDGINIVEFDLAYSNTDGFLKRSLTFLIFALRSIGQVFTQKYDVLFSTTTPLTAGIPGIIGRWVRMKPFVFEVRDLWPELPKEMGVIKNPIILAMLSLLEFASYRSAHRCIGLSPGIISGIEKRGVKHSKIKLVPNGCDLSIFSKEVTPWRPGGVSGGDLLAVFTGTHGQANGLNAVLDVAEELKRRDCDNIKLLLIGQGKCKAELQEAAKRKGFDNIIFHDPVNKARLAQLMAGADIGMQLLANVPAFYYGTSPNKFFDYIAAGLPVLNNYPGWLADMISEHHCGYTVIPDNPSAFADALIHANEHREELALKGKSAQLLARTNFDRHELADEWQEWVTGAVSEI